MRKFIWLGVAVLVAVGGIWWLVQNQNPTRHTEKEGPVKIGFIGSLTGDLANWGIESKNSVALAVSEINTAGGINGRPLEVIYEDGKCEGAPAAGAAQKLINVDGVKILLTYCSLETMTVAPIAESNRALLFAPAATSPEITHAGDYVFRLAPSDAQPAAKLATLFNNQRIAVVTEVSDFSNAFRDNLIANLRPNTQLVFNESFPGGTNDFRSLLTKLKAATPEAVVVNTNTPMAEGLLMKQMTELGINLPRYGIYWGADPEFLSTAGAAAEGFVFFNFVADTDSPRIAGFLTAYEQAYGATPPNPQFAILSYDALFILARAIKTVGYEPGKLRDYLYSMSPYEALSGTVNFDANGDSHGISFNLFEVKNGRPVPIN